MLFWNQSQFLEVLCSFLNLQQHFVVVFFHCYFYWSGFYTDPLPFVGPRDTDPFTADPPILIVEDRRFFTLGAGLLLDEVVQVDLAWARGESTQIEENMSGLQSNVLREEYVLTRLFMGVAYHF